MIFTQTPLAGVFLVDLQPIGDNRGWFSRYFCKVEFRQIGFEKEWVQMNHSYTSKKGSIRGMHFQFPPYSEVKLVRCIRGKVFDVVIDIREKSDTFLKWIGVEMSSENRRAIFIPEGFAHGFQTLEDDCELIYSHSNFFVKGVEGGLRYNDPAIAIHWPLALSEISERDSSHSYIDHTFTGLKTK